MVKKFLSLLLYLLFVLVTTLLLLEVCYRFYVVDFYKGSLIGLNSKEDLDSNKDQETILVFGDSFSADTGSYVKYLRYALPEYRIINTAVSGTTIRQHELMAEKRINRFDPTVIIYQIYLGNDLLEYRHPTAGNALSLLRKIYWWVSDRMLVVAYINAKLPQLKKLLNAKTNKGKDAKLSANYSPENYSQRVKMQFAVEPQLLEHTVLLEEERQADFHAYKQDLANLFRMKPTNCQLIVLLMPHCAQLGTPYLERMEKIGALFEDKAAFLNPNFPFLSELKTYFSKDDYLFVNVLEYLNEREDDERVYYENDPHLNAEGQFIVANILASFLKN